VAEALRHGGALVHVIFDPVDLAVGVFEQWVLADCKTIDSDGGFRVPKKQREALERIQAHGLPFVFLCDVDEAKKFVGSKSGFKAMCDQGKSQLNSLLAVLRSKEPVPRRKSVWVKTQVVDGELRFG
jgi:hypothetical protein